MENLNKEHNLDEDINIDKDEYFLNPEMDNLFFFPTDK